MTNKKVLNQFYVFDKQVNQKLAVAELIKTSEISRGGYVTIITSAVKENRKKAIDLRNIFYKQGIVGVHIITLNNKTTLKKTDVLTIENSKIICILENKTRVFMSIANRINLKSNLKKAAENGCLISGLGKSYEMFGDFFLFRHVDTTKNFNRLIQRNGLALQSGIIFTEIGFLNSNYDELKDKYAEKDISFLGIKRGTYLLINQSKARVFGNKSIEFITTDNNKKIIKPGEIFNFQAN